MKNKQQQHSSHLPHTQSHEHTYILTSKCTECKRKWSSERTYEMQKIIRHQKIYK